MRLARDYNDDGEPIGYRVLKGIEFLSQAHRDVFETR